jgi:hypothetical protein
VGVLVGCGSQGIRRECCCSGCRVSLCLDGLLRFAEAEAAAIFIRVTWKMLSCCGSASESAAALFSSRSCLATARPGNRHFC